MQELKKKEDSKLIHIKIVGFGAKIKRTIKQRGIKILGFVPKTEFTIFELPDMGVAYALLALSRKEKWDARIVPLQAVPISLLIKGDEL